MGVLLGCKRKASGPRVGALFRRRASERGAYGLSEVPGFDQNLAAHGERLASNRARRVMQGDRRRSAAIMTGDIHRAKVVLLASTC